MSFRELEWSILNFWHSGTGGMRAAGIGQSFAMIHLSSCAILNHKQYLCQLRNRKKKLWSKIPLLSLLSIKVGPYKHKHDLTGALPAAKSFSF